MLFSDIVTLNYGIKIQCYHTSTRRSCTRIVRFELTGNMNRYVWSMDNKVFLETDKISIKKGENVRIVLYNNSMMPRCIYTVSDFSLMNGKEEYAPLKNVLHYIMRKRTTI
jgi:FtsP/CotA-like multicopper oxidase with cupredoxin domain